MKRYVIVFAAFFCVAAFAQEPLDIAVEQELPATAAGQDVQDIAAEREPPAPEAVQDTPDIAVEQEPPVPATVQDTPDIAVEQESPATAVGEELPEVAAEQNIPDTATPEPPQTTAATVQSEPEAGAASRKKSKIKFSMGAGGFFAGSFDGGITWNSGARVAMPYYGGGAHVFVDAAYVEIFGGYSTGGGKWVSASVSDKNDLPDMQRAYVHGGLFVKYPFVFGSVKIFPLLGAEYEYALSGKLKYEKLYGEYNFDGQHTSLNTNALNAPWGKFGCGFDFDKSKRIYLRSEFLYGVRTSNWFEEYYADKQTSNGNGKANVGLGHGLTVKIGMGVRL